MWKDQITLIAVTSSGNDIGDTVETETQSTIFANKKSIRQSEYYQALSAGLKAAITFEIHSFEYSGQKKLEHNSIDYNIIRTFEKGDFLELICEAVV